MDATAVDLGVVLAGSLAVVLVAFRIAEKSLGFFAPMLKEWWAERKGKPEPEEPKPYTGPERRRFFCPGSPEVALQLMQQHRDIIREQRDLHDAMGATIAQLQQGRERDAKLLEAAQGLAESVRALRQETAVANAEARTKLNVLMAAAGR